MSATPIADMIDELAGAGLPLDAIKLAVRAVELSRTSPGQVPDKQEYERVRKRVWRSKTNALRTKPEANDAGIVSLNVPDNGDNRCELSSSLLSEKGFQEGKKQTEIVAPTRKNVSRGTRLAPDAILSEADRQFAIDNGVSEPAKLWAEFVDFWIGVPGQRGTKLNWSGTWRNRVRAVAGQTGAPNGHRGPRPLQDDAKSVSKTLGSMATATEKGEFVIKPRPSLLHHGGESHLRLLPKG
jgi:hypothetical protein